LDTEADLGRKLNDFNPKLVEAVGIEHRAIRLTWTILERFRGQVSMRTRPKNTSKMCYRTFLWQCHKSLMWIGSSRRSARCSKWLMHSGEGVGASLRTPRGRRWPHAKARDPEDW